MTLIVVCNYLSHNLSRTLYNICLVAFTVHTMYHMNQQLTILTLFVIPSFYFPSKYIGAKAASMKQEGFKIRTKMNNWLSDTLSINGQLLVKNFGQQQYAEKTFEDYSNQVKALEIRRNFLYALFSQVPQKIPLLILCSSYFSVSWLARSLSSCLDFQPLCSIISSTKSFLKK